MRFNYRESRADYAWMIVYAVVFAIAVAVWAYGAFFYEESDECCFDRHQVRIVHGVVVHGIEKGND